MNQQSVVSLMLGSKSHAEWIKHIEKVEKHLGGLPHYWYDAIERTDIRGQSMRINGWTLDPMREERPAPRRRAVPAVQAL